MQQLVRKHGKKKLQATRRMFNWHYRLQTGCLISITG